MLGLINGLIFIYIIPPWQHYDEPTHFEYVWLIANRPNLPKPGDFDQEMRREMAASMIEHNFFRGMNGHANLLTSNEPIWVGISQLSDPPIYYWIASFPLRLFRYTDITFQLYLVRAVSLILFLLTILCASGIINELASPESPMRWLLPICIALFPGLTDIMTAVNNDVGATTIFSLFLLISLIIIQRGFTWYRLAGLLASAFACIWTKNTVAFASILIFIPLLFSILRGSNAKYAWLIILLAIFGIGISIFSMGDAAYWWRRSQQISPTKQSLAEAPIGKSAFRLNITPENPSPRITQIFPTSRLDRLRGKLVTVGAWIWAETDAQVKTPLLQDGNRYNFATVSVGKSPRFFVFSAKIDKNAPFLMILLSPAGDLKKTTNTVYYDGIIFVEGDYTHAGQPIIMDNVGDTIYWNGKQLSNMLQNGSAEDSWPWIKPWAERLITKYYPVKPSLMLYSMLYSKVSVWYYKQATWNLFTTFWAKFGWGNIKFASIKTYLLLAIITLAGILGTTSFLWHHRRSLQWEVVLFLAIILTFSWGAALMRGIDSIIGSVFLPSARYAYPSVIPTIILIVKGWLELCRSGERYIKLPIYVKYVSSIGFFIGLNVLSIIRILQYYK